MLFRYLDRLRQEPQHVRTRHAFLVAFSVTAVIAIGWAFTLPGVMQNGGADVTAEVTQRPLASLWQKAREQMGAAFSGFGTTTQPRTVNGEAVAGGATGTRFITLTADDVVAARASSSIEYTPAPTTTPRVVRIATTTRSASPVIVASTTIKTIR